MWNLSNLPLAETSWGTICPIHCDLASACLSETATWATSIGFAEWSPGTEWSWATISKLWVQGWNRSDRIWQDAIWAYMAYIWGLHDYIYLFFLFRLCFSVFHDVPFFEYDITWLTGCFFFFKRTCRVSGELYQAYLAKDMWHLFDSSSAARLVNRVNSLVGPVWKQYWTLLGGCDTEQLHDTIYIYTYIYILHIWFNVGLSPLTPAPRKGHTITKHQWTKLCLSLQLQWAKLRKLGS